ncbi:MAG: hypothetical protein O7D34_08490, partial [Ignavibacteria bacterium]|nr:hypothetical protein [Ignavibacteria bacterium]
MKRFLTFAPRSLSLLDCCTFTAVFLILAFSSASAQWMDQKPWLRSEATDFPRELLKPTAASLGSFARFDGDSVFTVLGRWAWGPCEAVDVQGSYAYIGNGPTLHVLDVSNPVLPTIVGEYLTDGYVSDIRLRDTLAFLAIGTGLLVLNISNPLAPEFVSELNILGATFRLFPADSFVYVTTLSGAMWVIDISAPTLPVLRGGIPVGGMFPRCLAARNRYVYMGNDEERYLAIIDATNPDTLSLSFLDIGGWGGSATVQDTILMVGVNSVLKLYTVTNPAMPVFLGSLDLGDWIFGITAVGSMAYAATAESGTCAIDISDPMQPQLRSKLRRTLSTQFGVNSVAVTGQLVVAPYYTGVRVIDAMDPDSLQELAFFPTGGSAERVAIKDSIAYIASGLAGLWIVDLSDSEQPRGISNVNTGGFASDVEVADSFAYVVNAAVYSAGDSSRGLWVVDISDPSHPQVVSHHTGIARSSGSHPNTLAREGSLVFMTQAWSGPNAEPILEIIDVSNPLQPTQLGVFEAKFSAYYVDVKDSIAYLASPDSGLRIIDWHDSSDPRQISRVLGSAPGVAVRDTLVFVVTDTIYVINVSNPFVPHVLGTGPTGAFGNTSFDVTVDRNFVYWAGRQLGLVDVSNPFSPTQIGNFSGSNWVRGVAAEENTVVFTDVTRGVWILRNKLVTAVEDQQWHSIPESFELYQNYPNPFNAQTTIEFFAP